MSGEHAAIVTILADSFLEDLGSTNGTLVNGASVAKHFLRDRDEIDIGQEILVYLADDAATLEAPPASGPQASRRQAGRQRGRCRSDGPGWGQRRHRRAAGQAPLGPGRRGTCRRCARYARAVLRRRFRRRRGAEPTAAAPDAGIAVAPAPPPERQAGPVPALKVVDGAKAGRIVALVKDETLIGRTGVQVAALRRTAEEVRVVPVEGAHPPSVNGAPVAPEGQPLAAGDILEIAGTRLEVVAPARGPSA